MLILSLPLTSSPVFYFWDLKELSELICWIVLSFEVMPTPILLVLRDVLSLREVLVLLFSSLRGYSFRIPLLTLPFGEGSDVWVFFKFDLEGSVESNTDYTFDSIWAYSSTLLSDSLTARRYLEGSAVSRRTYFGIVSFRSTWFHSVRPTSWRTLTGSRKSCSS